MRDGVHDSSPKTVAIDNRLAGKSLWIGLAITGGWLVSRFSRKRQKAFVVANEKPEKSHRRQVRLDRSKVAGGGPGILSLGFDLLGAVAIRLAQRYAKSWSVGLMAQIKSSPEGPRVPPPLSSMKQTHSLDNLFKRRPQVRSFRRKSHIRKGSYRFLKTPRPSGWKTSVPSSAQRWLILPSFR